MSQRQQIARALKAIRPVIPSVSKRCPPGFTKINADRATYHLTEARVHLEAALELYGPFQERNGRPKPVLLHATGGR